MTNAASSNSAVINLHLSCHCRTFTSMVTFSSTILPLKSAVCHCSVCRHSTGHIFSTFAVIPLSDKPDCVGLTGFESSQNLTRWFCQTCGCSVWNDDRGNNEWEIATGVISGVTYVDSTALNPRIMSRGTGSPEGVEEEMKGIDGILNRVQLWISSTRDGGAAIWLNGGPSPGAELHWEARDSRSIDHKALNEMAQAARSKLSNNDTNVSDSNQLTASCGCHQIQLHITRPDLATKYQAGIDACWSCRKTSGFEITSWATIPSTHFSWADSGNPVTLSEGLFGRYSTSEGVMRYFCTGCGVPVFWHRAGRDTLDIGVGLLEADDSDQGVRIEDWLVWTKYGDRGVGYAEDAVDGRFVRGLVNGVWRDQGKL